MVKYTKWEDIPQEERKSYQDCPNCNRIFDYGSEEYDKHICGQCESCIVSGLIEDSLGDKWSSEFYFCPICGTRIDHDLQ